MVNLKQSHDNLLAICKELVQHLEWREDFLIEDANNGEINLYTRAKQIIKQSEKKK